MKRTNIVSLFLVACATFFILNACIKQELTSPDQSRAGQGPTSRDLPAARKLAVVHGGQFDFQDLSIDSSPVGATDYALVYDASAGTNKRILIQNFGNGIPILADADGDTKIQVEESADDDTIRFDTAGVERGTVAPSGALKWYYPLHIGVDALQAYYIPNQSTSPGTMILGDGGGSLTTGSYDTVAGFQAGTSLTSGSSNTLYGYLSGNLLTTGNSNAGFGKQTLTQLTTGVQNTALGNLAMATTGIDPFYNTAVGWYALNLVEGDYNVGVGWYAGKFLTTSSYNVFLGGRAGQQVTTGGGNVYIGYNTGAGNVTGASNVMIGYRVGETSSGSNLLYIDNSETTTPLIYGEFDTDIVKIHGQLQLPSGVTGAAPTPQLALGSYYDNDNTASISHINFGNSFGIGVNGSPNQLNFFSNQEFGFYDDSSYTVPILVIRPTYIRWTDNDTPPTYYDEIHLKRDVNSGTDLTVQNLDTGVSANASIGVSNEDYQNDGDVRLGVTGANYTPIGGLYGDAGYLLIQPRIANGLSIISQPTGTDADIRFYTGGYAAANFRGKIEETGELKWHKPIHVGVDETQALYIPDQTTLTGSLIVGDGGTALVNTVDTDGQLNTVVGIGAGVSLTTSRGNTLLGYMAGNALGDNTRNNIAIGKNAMLSATGVNVDGNLAVGHHALETAVGYANVALGHDTLRYHQGNNTVAVGYQAGDAITTGLENFFVGFVSGGSTTTGNYNSFLGNYAGFYNITGSTNTYVGYQAGYANTGSGNVLIGYQAGKQAIADSNKLYIDNSNTTTPLIYGEFDTDLVTVYGKLHVGMDNTQAIYIPEQANFTGTMIVGDGGGSLSHSSGTQGFYNTFGGIGSGANASTTYNATGFGQGALASLTTGNGNSGFGKGALASISIDVGNTAVGSQAGGNLSGGSYYNTIMGWNSGFYVVEGDNNTIIGSRSGMGTPQDFSVSYDKNTLLGASTGWNLTTDSNNNTFLGYAAGYTTQGSGNIHIGYLAGYTAEGSNQLYIANDSYPVALLYGEFDNHLLRINGDTEIYNSSDLASESLNEEDFATHANWDVTGDFDDSGGNATYTHSTGTGTLTQTTGNMAISGSDDCWYNFTYTVSGYTGDGTAEVTTTFAATTTSLYLSNGTQTTWIRSKTSPGDFVISATSSSGGFTLDDLSLKRVNGGDILVRGDITSEGTIEGATLTEGGQAVYNASETPGGVLGGTWANPTLDNPILLDSTQVLYLPDQTDFTGTLILGDGGGSLSHGSGIEGFYNTLVGIGAGNVLTASSSTTAIGFYALSSTTGGAYNHNTAVGTYSLATNTIGTGNTAVGSASGMYLTGYYNTILGWNTAKYLDVGSYNVFLGVKAGFGSPQDIPPTADFSQNVAIGYQSGYSLSEGSTGNIFLGYEAGYSETGSDRLYIDNSNTQFPLIFGTFNNDNLYTNGDLEVRDPTDLSSEHLRETDFATHVYWAVTGDFDDSSGAAVYAHNTGSGTLTQNETNFLIKPANSESWYLFTYTVSGVSAGCTATITTSFASTATPLILANGIQSTIINTGSNPGDFVISATSTSGGFTLDDVSLKQVVGGDIEVNGQLILRAGVSGASPTPKIVFETGQFDEVGDPSISHIDLFKGDGLYGWGISAGALNSFAYTQFNFLDAHMKSDGPIFTIYGSPGASGGSKADWYIESYGPYKQRNVQAIYIPDQTNFTGTVIYGNGGGSLSHVSGTDGFANTFIGISSGTNTTTGWGNTFLGSSTGTGNTTGTQNTFIGYEAGKANTTNGSNLYLGYQAGLLNNGAGNIFLGNLAGSQETTGANKLYIENSNSATPLIYGEFDNDAVHINGDARVTDPGDLGGESLTETDFATHANWDVTGDFDDTGGNAAYVDSAGSGTLTQTSANMAIAGIGNSWYLFTYTTSGYTADPACTITTAFAASAVTLPLADGNRAVLFQSAVSPGDFVVSCTSTTGDVTFDDVSLKRITGGDLYVGGNMLVQGTVAGNPSGVTDVVAASGVTPAGYNLRVQSSTAGNCDISADPQIADGVDGQHLFIIGSDDTKTVQFDDGTGLHLAATCTLGEDDILHLIYLATPDEWIEVSCQNN